MKRITSLLCAALLLVMTACGSAQTLPSPSPSLSPLPSDTPPVSVTPEPSPSPTPTPSPSEEVSPPPLPIEYVNPLTGEPSEKDIANQKPIAIMLNNIKAAMPQQGNSQADIIYEIPAEGGITRMLGVYQDISSLGIVGSVRSARLYYWELAVGHDAVFVHAGGSPEFYEQKAASGLTTVDGVKGYYSYATTGLFWRDRERIDGKYYAYEHSLITDGEHLASILTKRGELGEHSEGYQYEMSFSENAAPPNGQNALTVTAPFSKNKSTIFHYDEVTGLYKAEQYGTAYIDGNTGCQIAVTNLLLLNTSCREVDDAGRLSVDLSSGNGWFACGGKIIPITWEKGSRDQQLRFFTEDGTPLVLGIGKSYVGILPLSRTVTAE